MLRKNNSLPLIAIAALFCCLGYCAISTLYKSDESLIKPVDEVIEETTDTLKAINTPNLKILPQLDITKIKVGQTLPLEKVFFKADSSALNSESYDALEEVFEFMKKNDNVTIEIGGHTNNLPSDKYCDKLSTSRAKSVANFLHLKGILETRISHKGYGKRNPIASNENNAGRKKNQRVEIKILSLDVSESIDSIRLETNPLNQLKSIPNSESENLFKTREYDNLFLALDDKKENNISPREVGMLGFLYLHGYGVKQDLLEARKLLEKGCDMGDNNSTCLLGYIYEKGLGPNQDLSKAHHFYNLSAENGFPLAMNNLGYLYEKGLGVTQNPSKAFYYYNKASELGDHMGLNNTGFAFLNGLGTVQDINKGIKLLEQSAEKGNIRAMNNLGDLYDTGVIVQRDAELATYWKTKGDSLKNAIHYYSRN